MWLTMVWLGSIEFQKINPVTYSDGAPVSSDWFDSKFCLAKARVGQNIAKVLCEVGFYFWNPTN